MRALGADIKHTPKDEGMIGAQTKARSYAQEYGAVYMNQFETEYNPSAYTHKLGKQLTDTLPNIDYFVAGVGSGGTFTGVAQHLKQYNVKNVIVEPEGSILNGGEAHSHDIEGIGSEKWPIFLERSLVDQIITVSDKDGFDNVKRLAQQEGLLVGSSSGAALQGALDIKNQIDKGVIVTIFQMEAIVICRKKYLNTKENNDEEKTQMIHGGHTTDDFTGAVTTPIYQTSTYLQDEIGDLRQGYEYSRTANPTRTAIESVIANLENGKHGFAFGSGMAAISAVIMLLDKGDHLILNSDVYGGTYRALTKVFTRYGIDVDFVDTTHIENVKDYIKPETKMLYVETPSNPLLRVTDIKRTAEIAKENNLISVVDNTFMTPYYQNPLDFGIDIVLHSATKYIGGHSDVVAGLVATADDELGERLAFISNSTGGVLGPQDSYLLVRGIKTLGLRMEQINRNVEAIVEMLQNHPSVQQVFHPSIKDHLNHDIHVAQASGHTGVVAFEVKDTEAAKQLIRETNYFTLAESLGAVESLISVPALMTHASIPADVRAKEGITDGLVRLSIGIEDTDDLVEDLKQAIDTLN